MSTDLTICSSYRPDDEPYLALERSSIHFEWTNSWPSNTLFESHRFLYEYERRGVRRLEILPFQLQSRDDKKRYTSGLLGFRCITLFEP